MQSNTKAWTFASAWSKDSHREIPATESQRWHAPHMCLGTVCLRRIDWFIHLRACSWIISRVVVPFSTPFNLILGVSDTECVPFQDDVIELSWRSNVSVQNAQLGFLEPSRVQNRLGYNSPKSEISPHWALAKKTKFSRAFPSRQLMHRLCLFTRHPEVNPHIYHIVCGWLIFFLINSILPCVVVSHPSFSASQIPHRESSFLF